MTIFVEDKNIPLILYSIALLIRAVMGIWSYAWLYDSALDKSISPYISYMTGVLVIAIILILGAWVYRIGVAHAKQKDMMRTAEMFFKLTVTESPLFIEMILSFALFVYVFIKYPLGVKVTGLSTQHMFLIHFLAALQIPLVLFDILILIIEAFHLRLFSPKRFLNAKKSGHTQAEEETVELNLATSSYSDHSE